MRIGIFSDIHGNIRALEASHAALLEEGVDTVVCIGDIVGYGARPKECIDFIREHKIASVRGNHDHYTTVRDREWDIQPYAHEVIKWTRELLDDEHLEWLGSLPYRLDYEGYCFVHSSLEAMDGEYWPYILDSKSALFHFFLQETQFAFFGHTHIPLLFTYDEEHRISIEILKKRKLDPARNCKYLVNPGSVGQPRDFDCRSSAIIFDTEEWSLSAVRAEYDIEQTQKEITDAGLPELLATRLSRGN